YHFALRNKKFHQYNRYYILGAIVLSLLLPFLNIPVYFTAAQTAASPVLRSLTGEVTISSGQLPVDSEELANEPGWISVTNITWLIYGLLTAVALTRLVFSLLRIRKMTRNNPV